MLTRRRLLQAAAAGTAGLVLPRHAHSFVPDAAQTPLRQLKHSAVTLLPGPLQEQFAYHHKLLLGLDNDALLKPLRERTGLPAPGEDMGGWYSNSPFFDPHGSFDGFVPGHSFGQYLSGLSRAFAITRDPATLAKVQALLTGVGPTLNGRFYNDYTLPAYTFDKLFCGLNEADSLAGAGSAAPLLTAALNAALPHLPEKALSRPEQHVRPHANDAQTWDETYTLPENLFLAYRRTGNPAFREAAARFLEDDLYFNPLSEDINVLPGEHAYSHVNAFSSAMQAYLTLGSEKHLRAARNGFRMLEAQSFATGGWGPGETLLRPGTDDLGRSLFTQPASFETPCGAYGHFKIARYLLTVTGDAHYGDSIERVLYNTVLGARPLLPDGTSFYYADYTMTAHKTYARDKWPCCSGTLPQITADYGITSYFLGTAGTSNQVAANQVSTDANGLTVVLYVPSRVTWMHGGSPVTLTQETGYPAVPTTRMTLSLEKDAAFTLALRIPAWAGARTRVLVNGKSIADTVQPGTFYGLRRTWHSGDRVELEFDMPLRTEKLTVASVGSASTAPQASAPLSAEQPGVPATSVPSPASPVRLAALLRGPEVFMATGAWPTEVDEHALLSAEVSTSGDLITVKQASRPAVMHKPYPAIGAEAYRCYQPLKSA